MKFLQGDISNEVYFLPLKEAIIFWSHTVCGISKHVKFNSMNFTLKMINPKNFCPDISKISFNEGWSNEFFAIFRQKKPLNNQETAYLVLYSENKVTAYGYC